LRRLRLRIVKVFLGDRVLTTSLLAAGSARCLPGSVYRQVALLTKAVVLQVVAHFGDAGTPEALLARL
jgi:hypothetical protein